jgi:hypothetical protein
MVHFLRSTCPPDPAVTVFSELRQALEVQQCAIADRLEAVRQAEAALAHLHDVLAMPFLPLPGLTARVEASPGLTLPPDPSDVACAASAGPPEASPGVAPGAPGREEAVLGLPLPADPTSPVLDARRQGQQRACETCGEHFEPRRRGGQQQIFCSPRCRQRAHAGRRKPRGNGPAPEEPPGPFTTMT